MDRVLAVLIVLSICMVNVPVLAAPSLNFELATAQGRFAELNERVSRLEVEQAKAESRYQAAKREHERNEKALELARQKYVRASKNSDIVSFDQLDKLLSAYRAAQQLHRTSGKALHVAEKELSTKDNDLRVAKLQQVNMGIEVLGIKSRIYEDKLKQAIWVEGYGECTLGEDKTIRACQRLARRYAEQDAIERGSKAFIETLTEVKDFELVRDEIKKSSSVVVVEQDNSGDYGQIKRTVDENFIKYYVSVRLKIEGVAGRHNPFEEKIRQLKAGASEPEGILSRSHDEDESTSVASPASVEEELEVQVINSRPKRVVEEKTAVIQSEEEQRKFIPLPGF